MNWVASNLPNVISNALIIDLANVEYAFKWEPCIKCIIWTNANQMSEKKKLNAASSPKQHTNVDLKWARPRVNLNSLSDLIVHRETQKPKL